MGAEGLRLGPPNSFWGVLRHAVCYNDGPLLWVFGLASDWFVIVIFSGVERSITGMVRCSCKLDLQ